MSPRPSFPPAPRKTTKHRVVIGMMLAVVLAGGLFSFLSSGSKAPRQVARKQEVITITLPPPPPPPPPPKVEPPPPTEEKPKEELVEEEPEPLEEPPPEAPVDPPSEVLGTNIKGDGPGMSGLGSSGNGGGNRNSIGGGASEQARIDWYAKRILVSTIKEALERDPETRILILNHGIRVWVDKTGRITRVKPLGASNNLTALQKVLVGLRTSQAPPTGMPSSVDIRISARKASS